MPSIAPLCAHIILNYGWNPRKPAKFFPPCAFFIHTFRCFPALAPRTLSRVRIYLRLHRLNPVDTGLRQLCRRYFPFCQAAPQPAFMFSSLSSIALLVHYTLARQSIRLPFGAFLSISSRSQTFPGMSSRTTFCCFKNIARRFHASVSSSLSFSACTRFHPGFLQHLFFSSVRLEHRKRCDFFLLLLL